jgi:hypothetical protein
MIFGGGTMKITIMAATLCSSLALGVSPASAQSAPLAMQWGRDTLATCAHTEDGGRRNSTAALICLGWINGATQAAAGTISTEPEKPDYCTPGFGGSTGQYAAVFLKFLRDNPAKQHLPAIYLFHQAMAQAFPCR